MSKTHGGGRSITSRREFERALLALVRAARGNDVRMEGAYAAEGDDGRTLNVRVTEAPSPGETAGAGTDGERRPGVETTDVVTRASLVQVLTGLRLDRDGCEAACSECETEFVDGSHVAAVAAKPVEDLRWRLRAAYCRECAVDELETYRFGRADALFTATVTETLTAARQTGWRVARDVEIADFSPPSEVARCS